MARVSAADHAVPVEAQLVVLLLLPGQGTKLVEPFTVYTPSTITNFQVRDGIVAPNLVPIAMLLPNASLFHLGQNRLFVNPGKPGSGSRLHLGR